MELSTGSLLIRVETDASGNIISDKAWNEIILKEANENRSENGTLNGVVIDAMTGEGVPAAKLEFKAKENAENSTHVTSGKDGSFSIELAADVYEVTISADGYVDETFEFEMEKDKKLQRRAVYDFTGAGGGQRAYRIGMERTASGSRLVSVGKYG